MNDVHIYIVATDTYIARRGAEERRLKAIVPPGRDVMSWWFSGGCRKLQWADDHDDIPENVLDHILAQFA